MTFIAESELAGQRIDLIGRQTDIILGTTTIGVPQTIFRTNSSAWPAGSGRTFVAYVILDRTDGIDNFDTLGAANFQIGANAFNNDWLNNTSIAGQPSPLTLYAGIVTSINNCPGNYANGVAFAINVQAWLGLAEATVTISCYGWAT